MPTTLLKTIDWEVTEDNGAVVFHQRIIAVVYLLAIGLAVIGALFGVRAWAIQTDAAPVWLAPASFVVGGAMLAALGVLAVIILTLVPGTLAVIELANGNISHRKGTGHITAGDLTLDADHGVTSLIAKVNGTDLRIFAFPDETRQLLEILFAELQSLLRAPPPIKNTAPRPRLDDGPGGLVALALGILWTIAGAIWFHGPYFATTGSWHSLQTFPVWLAGLIMLALALHQVSVRRALRASRDRR